MVNLGDIFDLGSKIPKIDTENPPEKLDKVEKSLDSLKGQIKGKEIDKVETPLHDAFKVDCKEAGIDDTAEENYWTEIDKQVKEKVAEGTLEFKMIEDFVNNTESLKVLKETLASKDPLAKAKKWIERIRAIPIFGAWILSYAHDTLIKWSKNKETQKDNPGADELRAFAALLVDKDKKEAKPKTPEEEAKAKEKEMIDSLKKKFSDQKMDLEESSIALGIGELAKENIKDEGEKKGLSDLVDASMKPEGHFNKIKLAIERKQSDTNRFTYKLTDIRLQKLLSPEQAEIMVAAISKGKVNGEDSKYVMKDYSMPEIREFMNAALTMKNGNLEEAIKKYEKPAPTPAADGDKKGGKK